MVRKQSHSSGTASRKSWFILGIVVVIVLIGVALYSSFREQDGKAVAGKAHGDGEGLRCEVSPGGCGVGYSPIVYLNQRNNAHGYKTGDGSKSVLCCQVVSAECEPNNANKLFFLNQNNNAHASWDFGNEYTTPVCIKGARCSTNSHEGVRIISIKPTSNGHIYTDAVRSPGANIFCKLTGEEAVDAAVAEERSRQGETCPLVAARRNLPPRLKCDPKTNKLMYCDADGRTAGEYLCDNQNWVACDSSNRGVVKGNLACKPGAKRTAGTWIPCNDGFNQQSILRTSTYCSGGSWQTCSAIGLVAGNSLLCKQTRGTFSVLPCTIGEEDTEDSNYYCSGGQWQPCGGAVDCSGGRAQHCDEAAARQKKVVGDRIYCDDIAAAWKECGSELNKACSGNRLHTCGADANGKLIDGDHSLYCSTDTWIQCDADTKGQGVDNAPNAEEYNNDFVCDGTNWQYIEKYCSCQDARCVGSNFLKILPRTESLAVYYLDQNNMQKLIGCVEETECRYGEEGQRFRFDEKITHSNARIGGLVCGNNNHWLQCPADAQSIASDGGRWLCKQGNWIECTSDINGEQQDRYICTYNDFTRSSTWISEFGCDPGRKYQLRNGGREICDGEDWRTVASITPAHPLEDPRNANVQIEVTNIFAVKESICNNNLDDDNDGLTDCVDTLDCAAANDYNISSGALYELVLKNGDCFKANIIKEDNTRIEQLSACNENTRQRVDQLELCDAGQRRVVTATSRLSNQPPLLDGSVSFLYPEAFLYPRGNVIKNVSVILFKDLSVAEQTFATGSFISNVLAGQRILLKLDSEYYLLSHPETPLFDMGSLQLRHLKIDKVSSAEEIGVSGQYQFSALAEKAIKIREDTVAQQIIIGRGRPVQALAGIATEGDLLHDYEVQFNLTTPKNIINPALGKLSICSSDREAVKIQAQVCRHEDTPLRGFRRGNVTSVVMDDVNYAIQYDVLDGKKVVSIFNIHNALSTDLEYNNFIDAMVAGRRVVLKFVDRLYLVSHPARGDFSLTKLRLAHISDDLTQLILPSGSEDRVSFLVPEGEIVFQQNYGDPQPPIEVRSTLKADLAPVDMNRQLFTSVSSLLERRVVNPAFGMVQSADGARYRINAAVFNIHLEGSAVPPPAGVASQDILLRYRTPHVQSGVLFYYHGRNETSGELIKTASLYRLYDLDDAGPNNHIYDEEFQRALGKGNPLAFKIGKSYYVLGYDNQGRPMVSFNPNQLTLAKLDGSETYSPSGDEDAVLFPVPEGRIRVNLDVVTDLIEFSKEKGRQLLEANEFEGYVAELSPTNKIVIAGTNYQMCSVSSYAPYPGAEVCEELRETGILVDPIGFLFVDGQHYVLESNQRTGDNKRVAIRQLWNLNKDTGFDHDDWVELTAAIANNQKPYFNISGVLYVPFIGEEATLANFGLAKYGAREAAVYPDVSKITPITFNGSFMLHDSIIVVRQERTGENKIAAHFRVQPYQFLPANGEPLVVNLPINPLVLSSSIDFTPSTDGSTYKLTVRQWFSLVNIELLRTSDNVLYLSRPFAKDDTRTIRLDNVLVEIKVTHLDKESMTVTVRRLS